jgi:hypothetical protein
MKKYLAIFVLILSGCNNMYCFDPEDITNMYSSYITEWQEKCKSAFDNAEKEVFKVDPNPQPVVDTDPDPAKCVCKGTGIIVQGDGHKTICPFHAKTTNLKR